MTAIQENETQREFHGCPEQFGGCPECGDNDGFLNAGSTHVFVCHEHKISWIYGCNIFSSWRDQTEAEQRAAYAKIENYERVEPIFPKSTEVQF